MAIDSMALYLGNIGNEDCGFTVGMKYKIQDFEDGYIGVYDNHDVYRYIKNDSFHKFKLHCEDEYFVTETECVVMPHSDDKSPKLRYYINGHEVDMVEFGNVRHIVRQLDYDDVKCDTINFEVKYQ